MDEEINTAVAIETTRLLAQLDDAIDQSSVMREIVDKCQLLHNLESITRAIGKNPNPAQGDRIDGTRAQI